MMQEYEEFKSIAEEVTAKLNSNTEWIERFAGYAKGINENLNKIKDKKKQFREWAPLHLYISVGSAKDSVKFSLRYLGQDVANLTVNGQEVLLTTEDYAIKNKRNFGYEASSGEIMPWRSREAASFREYFRRLPPRKKYGKDNDEHRIESMILSELSKNIGTDKSPQLHAIRPVKIAEICRFQMPTPFSASTGEPKYLANGHGHIDILARVGKGSSTKLCIMEVKDEYSKRSRLIRF